jgi:predicted O-methyltransferase YrrM
MTTQIDRAVTITGFTHEADLQWLADRAHGRRTIVEIGSWQGRSTRAMADAQPEDGLLYAIDYWSVTPETAEEEADYQQGERLEDVKAAFLVNLEDLIVSGRVVPVDHDSQRGVPPCLEGAAVDLLFIDGDHRYAAVRSDIQLFTPLVRRGGVICGHDYSVHHPGVQRAVDEAYGARVQSISKFRSIWWVTV